MGVFDQAEFDIRFEWGIRGVETLAPVSDVVIVVDVLRFTTSVTAAVERNAIIYPYSWKDYSSVEEFARSMQAHVAQGATSGSYSLSPHSMKAIPAGTRLVLPSPNGSALSFAAQRLTRNVIAGCLRNATSAARAAKTLGTSIAVIAAGERWKQSDELRPAVEDLVGAGAIIRRLSADKSPEARIAERAWESAQSWMSAFLRQTVSGKELIEMGYEEDVEFAASVDASDAVPILKEQAFMLWDSAREVSK